MDSLHQVRHWIGNPSHPHMYNQLSQGCTNLERKVTRPTTSCTLASNICQSSIWNVLHVTILVPRILMCLLDFWKLCGTLRLTNDFI